MKKHSTKQNKKNDPSTSSAQNLAEEIVRILIDSRARDLVCLDARGHSGIADFFVICSGTSDTHLRTLADKVTETMKKSDQAPNFLCGYPSSSWVIIDFSDVIVHLFLEETRSFYKIEELLEKATPIQLPKDLEEQVKKLRTGLF